MGHKNIKINVQGLQVGFMETDQKDFICITDIAKQQNNGVKKILIKKGISGIMPMYANWCVWRTSKILMQYGLMRQCRNRRGLLSLTR